MNVDRRIVGACALVALLATAGCGEKEKDKPEHAEKEATTAAPQPTHEATPPPKETAAAKEAEPKEPKEAKEPAKEAAKEEPVPPPPADVVETPGKAPSPHHYWVHGYHYWDGHKYDWYKGYWYDEAVFAPTAPPALREEHAWRSPGANYFFMPGYWHWREKEYAWAPGHWGVKREGYAYVHPVYLEEKGHWFRRGFGWEKEDAAWKKRYLPNWEIRENVYVHKTEVPGWEKRGEREGWWKKH